MERKIQNLIFPIQEKFYMQWQLFYKGNRSYMDRQQKCLRMGQYQTCDFTTYFNGCSYRKWKRYTNIKGLKILLDIEGSFRITLVGYHLDVYNPIRKEFVSKEYYLDGRQLIEIEYPENEDSIIGFEINSFSGCNIYGGGYIGKYDVTDVRNVTLALATTTCNKETFITSNMQILKEEIIESKIEEIRNNIYIHVVDNGRTLNPEEWNEAHLKVHPNKNTGGAGGFARGMLEAMYQQPSVSHVLLMDDDVIILPESIYRTYMLLTMLKSEYQNYFISGAMLYYEEMNMQHEDIGFVNSNAEFCSLKPKLFHDILRDNLTNELDFIEQQNEYAAWWYCCIPIAQIKKNGLPLPIFVRCDDIEYSLRCKAKIITMNGICIWHLGFVNKYNAAFDRYQQCRNLLIGNVFDRYKDVDIFEFWKKTFHMELMRFSYDAAELVLRAMEDFMQGPSFLEKNEGEQILRENMKKNEKMIPLGKLKLGEINYGDLYCDRPRKFIDKCIYHATKNGQRFWPEIFLRKEKMMVPFDYGIVTQKQTLRKTLVSINPQLKTGAIRELDKKRFKEVYKRYKKNLRNYRKKHEMIESEYRKYEKYLISEEFWKKYLDISLGGGKLRSPKENKQFMIFSAIGIFFIVDTYAFCPFDFRGYFIQYNLYISLMCRLSYPYACSG